MDTHNLLLGRHAPDQLVAFGAGGDKTAADLLADAATVAAALPPATEPNSQVLMVFRSDRYAFAAALLGVWAAGHTAVLPPNQRGETISHLVLQKHIRALVHDTGVGGHIAVPALLGQNDVPPLSRVVLPADVAAYSLTSGTTGASEIWPKTAHQLLAEVAVLARTFRLPDAPRSIITVPPTHLYGLLFGVLLPLATGGAFLRETPLLPEAVAARVREFDAAVLVSVPVHLRTAQAIEPGALASLVQVFSSTAPLHEVTAVNFTNRHGLAINEIFGSTETGGIAWRARARDARWRPLDGVRIGVDETGRMAVESPFGPPTAGGPFVTADRIELDADGSFVHQGRNDGVVKVGGLRVSLPSMEDWLLQYPGVVDCVVVAVPELARGSRVLAVVVAPTLTESQLREAMSANFDPTTLPKRFLFLDRLPREANGKLQNSRVLRLFGLAPDGKPLARELTFNKPLTVSNEGHTVTVDVHVPEDYIWYGGHFETYPVMAGIVQLHELLLPLVQQFRPELGPIRALQRVKFLGRVAPGDTIQIELVFSAEAPECDFTIRKGARSCSAGRVSFFEPENLPGDEAEPLDAVGQVSSVPTVNPVDA
jgi:acyl-CoA synthetase (AMP-forming)/AMP-acid ligase II